MTLRLVGLMSAVLLLSLGAFGLLMGHFQHQVMGEVARTVSEVGRATLRTLEVSPGTDPASFTWLAQSTSDSSTTLGCRPAGTVGGEDVGTAFVSGDVARFTFNVEMVRTEDDPRRGLVLKIPRLVTTESGAAPAAGPADAPPGATVHMTRVLAIEHVRDAGALGPEPVMRQEDILLPVPVSEFGALFRSLRGRSLAVFLGVFAVGTVLSGGLAARFTRPIRRLDAGIRQLSAGDLDVRVDVGDRGEIGRLARAFNEMAGRLRAGREHGRELVRREKLSALGRLAAGVAHDVRNPLQAINLTLDHLRETSRPGEPPRAEEFDRSLDIIRGEIRRLDGLVGNFLRFARSEPRQRELVDLGELLRETVRLVSKEAEWRRIELVQRIDPDVPAILADGESVRSAVLNLVLNGFEAMPDGGVLTLSLSRADGHLIVEVADTGHGIPEADRERVFDFAYTTREGGTGLGLAIVHHSVVEEHGGHVSLESEPGRGTRVRLALPSGAVAGGTRS